MVHSYYEESDNFSNLPQEKIKSICAFCYYDGKFVIVKNEGRWEPVAGHVEEGETSVDALIREVREESNMKVLSFFPIGYLYSYDEDYYQTRYLCLTEPYGPFISDPDGGVTETKLIEPDDFLRYVSWKDTATLIKERCLRIIKDLKTV
jgi:8-oxo-dGTP pyrophosphatase MutT (NUDIX family)